MLFASVPGRTVNAKLCRLRSSVDMGGETLYKCRIVEITFTTPIQCAGVCSIDRRSKGEK